MTTPPRHVFLTISTCCNYQCLFCGNASNAGNSFLTLEKVMELESLVDGADCVDISGYGEIIMHPQFKELVTMLSKKQKKVSFSTNGSRLTKDIVDFLDTSSVHLLNISVNSLNPETYAKITKTGNLAVLLQNLEYLFSKKRNYLITLSAVVTNYAVKELEALIRYSYAHGGHQVRFLLMASGMNYPEGLALEDTEENRIAFQKAKDLAVELGMACPNATMSEVTPDVAALRDKCQCSTMQILVNPIGLITPCCWLGTKIMGDLRNNTWQEVWDGPVYQEFRESIRAGNSKYCRHCREFG